MEVPVVNKLAAIGRSPWYWLALLLLGLAMEGMALFYQHVLGYGPCVLCIQVRLWLLGLVMVALAALVMRRSRLGLVAAHALSALVLAGMLERAWKLLGIERGTVEGECSFDLGLPAWLPLDHWFPPLFQVQEACGYTPTLPFGFSMAEVLPVFSGLLLLLSVALLVASLASGRSSVRGS
jgi:disulfide bond formation protein DsbB